MSILKENPNLRLPNLEKLGLMNILGEEKNEMNFSKAAVFGKAALMHYGADTFFGHQEIMGSYPKKPSEYSINSKITTISNKLKEEGYDINILKGKNKDNKIIAVNNCLTIGDNIECDLGQAFNITAALDLISFEEVLKIGKIVRELVEVPRVIAFGGEGVSFSNIINAVEEKGSFMGVNAPLSGVYKKGYLCRHLGYGIDEKVQLPYLLSKKNIDTILLGKAADVIKNPTGDSYSIVDTEAVLEKTLEILKATGKKDSFICVNVQETDLAGHEENSIKYSEKLRISDSYIEKFMPLISESDLLIITADHGNDPTIKHSKHTREFVPILIYNPLLKNVNIGTRLSTSDIGQTIADYFKVSPTENGTSFLSQLT